MSEIDLWLKKARRMCRHRKFQVIISAGTVIGVTIDHFVPVVGTVLVLGASLLWIWED